MQVLDANSIIQKLQFLAIMPILYESFFDTLFVRVRV